MLENNTDRSYFMIGAMVVAGLLIAGGVLVFGAVTGENGMINDALESMKSAIPDITTPSPEGGGAGE